MALHRTHCVRFVPGGIRTIAGMNTIPKYTIPMDTIPNGHNPEWTQSRMDTIPNGHNPEWTQSRMDTIPNEHLPSYFGVLYASLISGFLQSRFY